uniref:ATP synthase subunit a n=1 Tax=Lepidopsocidae sp. RS-2001 TaxID=159971 RepID=Q7YHM0_9NEOP|nr:ATP synthase F0 subunit 6 [Lepidopsocidae sp. RS-2001]AAP44718.1 ATP synthase subunit 6 [Lepidopsocidae sp. RS-2001]
MNNLFSSFDPLTNIFNLPLNWLSSLLFIMFIPSLYWILPSRMQLIWNLIIKTLHNEFKTLLKNSSNFESTMIFISIFSFVLINNFLGLFPYIFTSTSQLVLTLTLSLPLWLSFMIYGWLNKTNHMFAHLVPNGTPGILMPFMVCIETISNIIRPGTLAVRLTANMIAGHLILTLLGNTGSNMTIFLVTFLIIIQIALLMLEMAVAFIQSYVIAILITLYSSEIN